MIVRSTASRINIVPALGKEGTNTLPYTLQGYRRVDPLKAWRTYWYLPYLHNHCKLSIEELTRYIVR